MTPDQQSRKAKSDRRRLMRDAKRLSRHVRAVNAETWGKKRSLTVEEARKT